MRRVARGLAPLLYCALGAPGCSSYIGVHGPAFDRGHDAQYFDELVFELHSKARGAVHPVLAADGELGVHGAPAGFGARCLAYPPLFRFTWLSDVQLRQREVKLYDDEVSRNWDNPIRTFEHDKVQEELDWALYLEQIEAVNGLAAQKAKDAAPIAFMMHTGDAIDAGTIEELYHFVVVTNALEIPWLDVVGNHDVDIFGNYKHPIGYTRGAAAHFYPVGSVPSFLRMHGPTRALSGFGAQLLPVPIEAHAPTLTGTGPAPSATIPPSRCHGFDLDTRGPAEASDETIDCGAFPGYYAFDVPATAQAAGKNLPIRVVVLDSHRKEGWGSEGQLDGPRDRSRQAVWLEKTLAGAEGRLTLVFAHHRPKDLFDGSHHYFDHVPPGQMIFFSGHTHEHHVELVSAGKARFFELNTGAILETPQVGRLVELRGANGRGCVVTRALWGSLSAPKKKDLLPDEATVAKEIAACDAAVAEGDRSPGKVPPRLEALRHDLGRAARCARLGGARDYYKERKQIWSPQSFSDGWKAANVIVPLTFPRGAP